MKTSDEKYEKLISDLRNAKQAQTPVSEIEDSVMNAISVKNMVPEERQNVFDFIFAWIWISWIRRGLITASICLVGFFIWQQNSILGKIENLQMQIRQSNRIVTYDPSFSTEKKLLLNRISEENKIPELITVRKEDLSRLIDSLQSVQSKYRDIIDMIEKDPLLKKAVQENLRKNTRHGLKL